METSKVYSNNIPYFEARTINTAELTVILNFKYPDGSSAVDTIHSLKTSERARGKEFKTLDLLEQECVEYLKSGFSRLYHVVTSDDQWFKFAKVKIKDKALKEEFKAANDLLNDKLV